MSWTEPVNSEDVLKKIEEKERLYIESEISIAHNAERLLREVDTRRTY